MPANLTPQYLAAEEEYRKARTIEEKIAALKKMWAYLPKHKGTDKLQADIKAKLSRLKKELEEEKKSGKSRRGFYVKKEGAGQIVLLGPPNTGKSSLLKSLTGKEVAIAEYPFTTQVPEVGMMPYEDIKIQIVDLPPITKDHFVYWQIDIIRGADLILIVLALDNGDSVFLFDDLLELLKSKNIILIGEGLSGDELFGPVKKRAIVIATKKDLDENGEVFNFLKEEIIKGRFPLLGISIMENLSALKKKLFEYLGIIRVYTKEPGKKPSMEDPLILKKGDTIRDAAARIHKDFAENLKFARVWGSSKFPGQRVEINYVLKDRDIVEFHI